MYVYIYIYIHTYIYVYMYIYIYTSRGVFTCHGPRRQAWLVVLQDAVCRSMGFSRGTQGYSQVRGVPAGSVHDASAAQGPSARRRHASVDALGRPGAVPAPPHSHLGPLPLRLVAPVPLSTCTPEGAGRAQQPRFFCWVVVGGIPDPVSM